MDADRTCQPDLRSIWEHDDFDAFLAEGADELEYVRARTRMEAFIADGR